MDKPKLDAKGLEKWLARYKDAWEGKDPDAAAALFTEDALYFETPYAEPFRGRTGIRDYWARVTADQRDIQVTVQALGVLPSGISIARWRSTFNLISNGAAVELDGVFLLEHGTPEHCSVLREWWHAR